MSQKKILVKTGGSGSGTQETYNAIQNNYQWSFNLPALTPGSISENTNIFTLESYDSGISIKAEYNERYLSLTVNGAGYPDSNPTFTSTKTSGESVVYITGTPVTVTKFDQVDKDGDTAFGFTVKVLRGANEWESFKYYFVPGSFLIGIMLANTPQYVFEVCS